MTYGCIVYQEQVIEIFRQLAGFSLGQADMIRRAMSKKKEAVITAERAAFVHGDRERNIPGAVARGVPEQTANDIYDEILAFASYAFNKAHAVSYAIVSYRTAYMKRNYPHEYMAALLTSVLDNTPKVTEYIAECRELGIRLLPPDINASDADFTVEGGDLRFGLVAIKGVGRGLIQALMREREIGGPFTAFDEFCRRMNGHDLNRRAVESLIRAGCFDRMGYKRKALMQSVDRVLNGAASESRMNLTGQMNLFSAPDDGGAPADTTQLVLPDVEEFTRAGAHGYGARDDGTLPHRPPDGRLTARSRSRPRPRPWAIFSRASMPRPRHAPLPRRAARRARRYLHCQPRARHAQEHAHGLPPA